MQYVASGACHDKVVRTIEISECGSLPLTLPLMEHELVISVSVLSQSRKKTVPQSQLCLDF